MLCRSRASHSFSSCSVAITLIAQPRVRMTKSRFDFSICFMNHPLMNSDVQTRSRILGSRFEVGDLNQFGIPISLVARAGVEAVQMEQAAQSRGVMFGLKLMPASPFAHSGAPLTFRGNLRGLSARLQLATSLFLPRRQLPVETKRGRITDVCFWHSLILIPPPPPLPLPPPPLHSPPPSPPPPNPIRYVFPSSPLCRSLYPFPTPFAPTPFAPLSFKGNVGETSERRGGTHKGAWIAY